jgi:hypothetical protein
MKWVMMNVNGKPRNATNIGDQGGYKGMLFKHLSKIICGTLERTEVIECKVRYCNLILVMMMMMMFKYSHQSSNVKKDWKKAGYVIRTKSVIIIIIIPLLLINLSDTEYKHIRVKSNQNYVNQEIYIRLNQMTAC